jgi:hypothetical protein
MASRRACSSSARLSRAALAACRISAVSETLRSNSWRHELPPSNKSKAAPKRSMCPVRGPNLQHARTGRGKASMTCGLGERSVGHVRNSVFFVEKNQSPLLHCVFGESSSPTKRSGVGKLRSYKKKRLGQKLLQVQYHRAFSAAMRDSDSRITVQQDRMSRLDDHRRNGGTMILRHS